MKVYLVEIGNTTRRGGFVAQSRFAVQSESEQSGIYSHYQKRYAGFAVNVSEVSVLEEKVVAFQGAYNMGEVEVECNVNYPKKENIEKAVTEFLESEQIYYEKRKELTRILNAEIGSIHIEDYKTRYFKGSFVTKVKLEKLLNLRTERGL